MKEISLTPRDYQQKIFETAKDNNTLVVLPTGLGKTLIALMLSVERQKKFPGKKALMLAPTRPLVEQHFKSYQKNLPELFADLQLFTGEIPAKQRQKTFQTADIIFSTPQCVDGETIIFTEEGPIKISEFFKNFEFKEGKYKNGTGKFADIKSKVLGYDGKKISFVNASKAWKSSKKGLIEIKTELGNTLLCTKDHPLLTINSVGEINWKEATRLNVGDYVASIKEINLEEKSFDILKLMSNSDSLKLSEKLKIKQMVEQLKKNKIKTSKYSRYLHNAMPLKLFLELAEKAGLSYKSLLVTDNYGKSSPVKIPEQLSFKLAYILGAMLGDGHLGDRFLHGGEVVFSDLDRESVSNEFQNAVKDVFGVEMKKEKRKGLIAYNSAFTTVLSLFGIPKGRKAKIIQIPRFLFFADKDSVKGFIKGIFDTDGSASGYNVSVSSISKKFIEELKWLFLMIGIHGNIEKRKNNGTIQGRKVKGSEIFAFRFSGRHNLLKFLEISPDINKCKKLIETLKAAKRPETRSKEILPVPDLMKKIKKDNINKAEYYKFSCLSLDNLRKLSVNLDGKDSLKLKELLGLPIRWVKIKDKKTNHKIKEMYDLTIEKHHNFIANCLISHNCIANDLKAGLYTLQDVSLLIIDEAHRCLKNYDYTKVVEFYKHQTPLELQRILGLTASPGSETENVKEICKHLAVDEIEIRSRDSPDVKPYLQELEFEKVVVPFPPEFLEIKLLLKKIHDSKTDELRRRNLLFGPANKFALLKLQGKLGAIYTSSRDFNAMIGMSLTATAIKLSHALELLETQTLSGVNEYFNNLIEQANQKKSKAVQTLVKSPEFTLARTFLQNLITKKVEHPKIEETAVIVENQFKEKENSKIIIFTQFRETGVTLTRRLNEISGIRAKSFFGQAKKSGTGLSQKEQKAIIEQLNSGEINVLVATSIGEEGLDIAEVSTVIFYEPIPSAIRKIQRTGRTARLKPGKLIILVTKDTRDVINHYASTAREKKMYKTIEGVRADIKESNKIKTLDDFK
ncbi:DEAD/DEAH box helicase [Candidatus Pacearchaeota archaeon]|nr:DEAD/DEAH box helicase [Candidatus Pacearchaeota archaeon]